MRVLGVPLHQISMTGLVIAIGLLIDNAIVMADEVQGRLQQGMTVPTWMQEGFSHPWLTRIYRWTLERAFSRPVLAVSLALILPVVGFTLVPHLQQQFFPPAGRNQFYIEFELPNQAALDQTQAQVLQARKLILQQPGVADVHWFLGESAPTFYYNVVGSRENVANYAQGARYSHS
jgi:multidrug efflux pump subunit AcrB